MRTPRKVDAQVVHRERNFWRFIWHLQENPCVDCGQDDIRTLHFDHLPGTDKKYDIGAAITQSTRSWQNILEEIAKCEVVCANCHQIRTSSRANHRKHQIMMGELTPPEDLWEKRTNHTVEHGGGVRGRRGCKCAPCRAKNSEYSAFNRAKKLAKLAETAA